jgi:type II secretory pathway component PulM
MAIVAERIVHVDAHRQAPWPRRLWAHRPIAVQLRAVLAVPREREVVHGGEQALIVRALLVEPALARIASDQTPIAVAGWRDFDIILKAAFDADLIVV